MVEYLIERKDIIHLEESQELSHGAVHILLLTDLKKGHRAADPHSLPWPEAHSLPWLLPSWTEERSQGLWRTLLFVASSSLAWGEISGPLTHTIDRDFFLACLMRDHTASDTNSWAWPLPPSSVEGSQRHWPIQSSMASFFPPWGGITAPLTHNHPWPLSS